MGIRGVLRNPIIGWLLDGRPDNEMFSLLPGGEPVFLSTETPVRMSVVIALGSLA